MAGEQEGHHFFIRMKEYITYQPSCSAVLLTSGTVARGSGEPCADPFLWHPLPSSYYCLETCQHDYVAFPLFDIKRVTGGVRLARAGSVIESET